MALDKAQIIRELTGGEKYHMRADVRVIVDQTVEQILAVESEAELVPILEELQEQLMEVLGEVESTSKPPKKRKRGAGSRTVDVFSEQLRKWLGELQIRFISLFTLHEGIAFSDVVMALWANPEAAKKLQALDEKGHAMNVFGMENGEFIFASAWGKWENVSSDHRNIAYDLEGQKLAVSRGEKVDGNAVDIAKAMGVDLADPALHEQLRTATTVNGWAWLKTDDTTRKIGHAFNGYDRGIGQGYADGHNVYGSFRASLRVKKATEKVDEHAELFQRLEASYDNMVDTLKEFGFNKQKPPTKKTVMDAIKKLTPKQLEAISKFGKPMICITPAGSFAQKVAAMNKNKKMPGQADTYLGKPENDSIWGGDISKMIVTVVDGLDALLQPSFITDDMNVGQRMDKYEAEFAKDQLEIMSTQEGVMIMMQSLKAGQPIDDFQTTMMVTYYSRTNLTKSSAVPYGYWDSAARQVRCYYADPDLQHDGLRCRPSVRVLET